ncbi:hypothetical protein BHM03_00061920 [Ensete ventricosum]|nr:hypothetical protein BHM03_00061920 [Ensete ventricosum]
MVRPPKSFSSYVAALTDISGVGGSPGDSFRARFRPVLVDLWRRTLAIAGTPAFEFVASSLSISPSCRRLSGEVLDPIIYRARARRRSRISRDSLWLTPLRATQIASPHPSEVGKPTSSSYIRASRSWSLHGSPSSRWRFPSFMIWMPGVSWSFETFFWESRLYRVSVEIFELSPSSGAVAANPLRNGPVERDVERVSF